MGAALFRVSMGMASPQLAGNGSGFQAFGAAFAARYDYLSACLVCADDG
jgi:hypothetical protein